MHHSFCSDAETRYKVGGGGWTTSHHSCPSTASDLRTQQWWVCNSGVVNSGNDHYNDSNITPTGHSTCKKQSPKIAHEPESCVSVSKVQRFVSELCLVEGVCVVGEDEEDNSSNHTLWPMWEAFPREEMRPKNSSWQTLWQENNDKNSQENSMQVFNIFTFKRQIKFVV